MPPAPITDIFRSGREKDPKASLFLLKFACSSGCVRTCVPRAPANMLKCNPFPLGGLPIPYSYGRSSDGGGSNRTGEEKTGSQKGWWQKTGYKLKHKKRFAEVQELPSGFEVVDGEDGKKWKDPICFAYKATEQPKRREKKRSIYIDREDGRGFVPLYNPVGESRVSKIMPMVPEEPAHQDANLAPATEDSTAQRSPLQDLLVVLVHVNLCVCE